MTGSNPTHPPGSTTGVGREGPMRGRRMPPHSIAAGLVLDGGPKAVKLAGGRGGAVRYRRRDVDAWARQNLETRTRERAT